MKGYHQRCTQVKLIIIIVIIIITTTISTFLPTSSVCLFHPVSRQGPTHFMMRHNAPVPSSSVTVPRAFIPSKGSQNASVLAALKSTLCKRPGYLCTITLVLIIKIAPPSDSILLTILMLPNNVL